MVRGTNGRDGGPRILLLSVAMGSGHVRAAQALELALRRVAPEATVQNVDLLELTNRLFRFFYGDFYLYLAQRHPHVLRWIYDSMDRPSWARKAYEHANMHGLVELLESEPWDLIVNTHFLPAEVIANLREEGRLATPDVTVVTDFEAHSMWCVKPCDLFCVATEEAARFVAAHGIPAESVRVTGIPIHPVFAEPKDRALCQARHGLIGHRPVVLQLAGGHGVGPIGEVYRGLLDVEQPLELVVVTGHNEEAQRHLEELPRPGRHRVTVLGYTDAMDELLTAADLVVSKAGGLTVSEALARGTPMVIVDPIPGQEERNSDYLLENGAALKANNLCTLPFMVGRLLRDPRRLEKMRESARRLGRPRAAFTIAECCLDLLAAHAARRDAALVGSAAG